MKDPLRHLERKCLKIRGIANLDVEREKSTGIPEVILGRGKDPEDLQTIAQSLLENKGHVIITKVEAAQFEKLNEIEAIKDFNRKAGVAVLRGGEKERSCFGRVAVFAAGTSDIPVAEEARIILEELGCKAIAAYDIGVAGIHRLIPWISKV
jgi:NCAIR mutase (PurE)-related protein